MRAAPWGEERDGCVGEEGGRVGDSEGDKRKVAGRGWEGGQRRRRRGAGSDGETDGGGELGAERERERERGKKYAKCLSRIC